MVIEKHVRVIENPNAGFEGSGFSAVGHIFCSLHCEIEDKVRGA